MFKVRSVPSNHPKATLQKSIICSLHSTAVYLVYYLGPNAPVSQMVNKLGLMCILMQNFYRLQQVKTKLVHAYVTHLEGSLYNLQKDHPHLLSQTDICNHLHDSLHYMYDDPMVSYSQQMTAGQKAEPELEDKGIKGARLRLHMLRKINLFMGYRNNLHN